MFDETNILSIDTPGVIERVSTLFKGHPNLIQGFNTFLPPGYRIECSLDPSDPNPIRVTTPTGATTRPGIGFGNQWAPGSNPELAQQNQVPQQAIYGAANVGYLRGDQQQEQQAPDGGQIEFNHAITYVNKIKTRFANQPDVYKQFLEILQTYQREQKPIAEVYEQVTELFAKSPDLLDDFKQFLPDTGAQNFAQGHPQHPNKDHAFYSVDDASQLPPVGNFQPPTGVVGGPQSQYQRYQAGPGAPGADDSSIMGGHALNGLNKPKRQSFSEAQNYPYNYGETQYSSLRSAPQNLKPVKAASRTSPATNPSLVTGVPEPVPPSGNVKASSLLEEMGFFDKVKKAIGNKQTYNEFLKILNLFSQDIIDRNTLVERVDGFIGEAHPELLRWFKMFVGYDDKPQHIETITFKKHQLELSLCKAYGPSYRQLPKAETYMPCSGRDEMCWEVLNDEWVGHPTWASEDSGFIAHRKNQYEEILFKIEEERHEFDFIMESNLRTIQTLETIANRIANMTPEQKANFKLPPGLGHTSQTIYKKVIRKVYDKARGFEVIDALHENPAVAVPIVLKRLKQKDEEWKRSHREWNKVWREMEQKVFYKSLDHLGLTFKQADKKLLTTKQLVSEISTVKIEQQNKRLHPLTPKPQEQLKYKFNDFDILVDILKLSEVFIQNSSNYSANDREKLIHFQKFFWTSFFNIPEEKLDEMLGKKQLAVGEVTGDDQDKFEDGTNVTEATRPTDTGDESNNKKRGRENDLLRDVLKRLTKSRDDDHHESPSHASSETEEPEANDEVSVMSELWVHTSPSTAVNKHSEEFNQNKRRDKYNLFCNTIIYVFFRHLTTLYRRLEKVKKMNNEVSSEIRGRKIPQFAKDLNLVSHQLEDMHIEISGDKDCYLQVLNLSERLIKGEIEHQWFEETLRQGYRNRAYELYTIDKVVQALVKHMYTIVSDSKHSEIILLFENDRCKPVSSAKEQILYRMQVRSFMNMDENMFKITYKESDHAVNIQFVSLDDLTINDHKDAEEKYNYYITSYVMSHPTEGVPASKINMPFLKSFIEEVDEEQCEGQSKSGLKVSICENSYRLFFEADTHDEFTSNSVYKGVRELTVEINSRAQALNEMINEDEIGWKKNLKDKNEVDFEDKRLSLLFEKGAKEYLGYKKTLESSEEDNSKSMTQDEELMKVENDAKVASDNAHDGDDTELQEHNDTTLQQTEGNDTTLQQHDVNDSTADETTVNQDDSSMTVDAHNYQN